MSTIDGSDSLNPSPGTCKENNRVNPDNEVSNVVQKSDKGQTRAELLAVPVAILHDVNRVLENFLSHTGIVPLD